MRIDDLKQALQGTTDIDVQTIIVDPAQEANISDAKDYPLILWDMNTLKFDTRNGRHPETIYTIDVFVVGYFDQDSKKTVKSKEEVWQELHPQFLEYIAKVNEDTKHEIVDLALTGEIYNEGGVSTDHEIGIGYTEIEIYQYCE